MAEDDGSCQYRALSSIGKGYLETGFAKKVWGEEEEEEEEAYGVIVLSKPPQYGNLFSQRRWKNAPPEEQTRILKDVQDHLRRWVFDLIKKSQVVITTFEEMNTIVNLTPDLQVESVEIKDIMPSTYPSKEIPTPEVFKLWFDPIFDSDWRHTIDKSGRKRPGSPLEGPRHQEPQFKQEGPSGHQEPPVKQESPIVVKKEEE
ncbi:hypothetical protein J3R30DRAFT_3800992 [Lentinula aciculospora]|uniref:Uncharacterized protein n=1 Tax=Lentinula aciculospora TaxID=153920 RepID=A0A9W9A1R4_9AGAR|nr:hypothetical protein J3R30DRAFT_3800992 [Lentinula aciculospora]